jgi:hypothetical protein
MRKKADHHCKTEKSLKQPEQRVCTEKLGDEGPPVEQHSTSMIFFLFFQINYFILFYHDKDN